MNASDDLSRQATTPASKGANRDPGQFGRTARRKASPAGWAALACMPLSVVWLQAAAAASDDCAPALTSAQRAKFQLALAQACSTSPDDAAALAQRALSARAVVPRSEAMQLQLFDAQGAVSARGDATPLRAVPSLGPLPSRPASALPRSAPAKPTAVPAATERALRLAPEVDAAAQRHDIDPLLLHAIAYVESRHNPSATSPAGARGLMQVMPATAQRFGVAAATSLTEPRTNLEVSATYLKTLQGRFGGDLPLVLAAYNAGEGAVERYGRRIPPYAETRSYVRQVLERYEWLSAIARQFPRPLPSPRSGPFAGQFSLSGAGDRR